MKKVVRQGEVTGEVFTRPEVVAYMLDGVRHCGKFRSLLRSPKILIPDIQLGGNVALDESGSYYPHHNVYWITSTKWNLKALCALLRSSFVTSQIRNVSVQMRGGSIRYQAQNLRNVHIPAWSSLSEGDVEKLVGAYESNDTGHLDAVVDAVVRDSCSRQPVRRYQADLFG